MLSAPSRSISQIASHFLSERAVLQIVGQAVFGFLEFLLVMDKVLDGGGCLVSETSPCSRILIKQAEALGERLEDSLPLASVLYGLWVANYAAFNGDVMRELAAQFLSLAEEQGAILPQMMGHRLMGTSLLLTGDPTEARIHLDRALALYNPAEHRALATRFGQDARVAAWSYRSWSHWLLGYPEAALMDAEMFSDLVGSTALSARTDPEDLREIISDYQKCVAEAMSLVWMGAAPAVDRG